MSHLRNMFKKPIAGIIMAGIVALLMFTLGRAHAQDTGGTTAPAPAPATTAAAAPAAAPTPDPSGTQTGQLVDVYGMATNAAVGPYDLTNTSDTGKQTKEIAAATKAEPYAVGLGAAIGHLKIATNTAWTLNTGYLVLFMQAGFALLTCGLVRKKNAGHLMMLNFAAYVIAFLGYYACGFAFMYGAVGISGGTQNPGNLGNAPTMVNWLIPNVLGKGGFFLTGPAYDAGVNCLFMFEVVFMETAGYIIVGAICERITFTGFILCELFVGAVLYPVFGAWNWGGGWMSQLGLTHHWGHGYVDFAGSTVVHGIGGFCAMALAVILGPRIGKYDRKGKPVAFPAHNLVFVVTGTFILLFGWMGFNPGSTLGATDLRIAVVAVNTNLAACFGALTAVIVWQLLFKKPDISMACNGMLAGLVAITAPCAFVNPTGASLVGILAGLMVCGGVLLNERILKIDDPCGAISVHGYCGWLGGVCVGLFADGKYGQGWNATGVTDYLGTKGTSLAGVSGIFFADVKDPSQLMVQLIGATTCAVWAFGATFIVFKIVNMVVKLRVSPEAEMAGLDVPEFGMLAYPEDEYPASDVNSETAMSSAFGGAEAPAN